jgi:hypothetical protein
MNRFRKLSPRCEKTDLSYCALLHLAADMIALDKAMSIFTDKYIMVTLAGRQWIQADNRQARGQEISLPASRKKSMIESIPNVGIP